MIPALRPHQAFKVAIPAFTPNRLSPPVELPGVTPRRRKLWDLATTLHCSIIGTCLGAGELRRIVAKATGDDVSRKNDHDIHKMAVVLASRSAPGGKLIHKALDQRHETVLRRFEKADTQALVTALWAEAKANGDIPGAYWALLTHPRASEDLAREAFGDVHMLSHMVGAANRADIRRLAALEAENEDLRDRLDRQQSALHEAVTKRDAEIRALRGELAARPEQPANGSMRGGAGDAEVLMDQLRRKSDAKASRIRALEEQCAALRREARDAQDAAALAHEQAMLSAREAASLEQLLSMDADAPAAVSTWDGSTILYVGGRDGAIPTLRRGVESRGANMLHHDGGQQESAQLLPGLISQADLVVFPLDCISHDAANAVKRHCRLAGKPFRMLPRSGLGALLRALDAEPSALAAE